MSETSTPGLGDLINLLSGTNPLAAIGKSIDQFKRGVNDFLHTVETFNETMTTINALAARATVLFDELEEPIRTIMPQVTRSLKAADLMITQISGPIEKVAPRISQLAETLSNPVFTSMPNDLAGFLDTLGDLTKRLQPLAQLAENAGGLFGMRSFASLLGGNSSSTPAPPPPPVAVISAPATGPTASAPKPSATKATKTSKPTKAPAARKGPAAKKPATASRATSPTKKSPPR